MTESMALKGVTGHWRFLLALVMCNECPSLTSNFSLSSGEVSSFFVSSGEASSFSLSSGEALSFSLSSGGSQAPLGSGLICKMVACISTLQCYCFGGQEGARGCCQGVAMFLSDDFSHADVRGVLVFFACFSSRCFSR